MFQSLREGGLRMNIPRTPDVNEFGHWLRTGRRLGRGSNPAVEVKHNPWHDPANGQFTFANSGVRYGRWGGGGGGTTGGGGASGGWPRSKPLPRRSKPSIIQKPQSPPGITPSRTVLVPAGKAPRPPVKPFRRITKNGYDFDLDSDNKMRRAAGSVSLGSATRNRRGQLEAGGTDRRSTDDGGHYVARRFNGPPDRFNLFPQDANFNRGKYRLLEDEWARAKRAGKNVEIEILPRFEAGSKRPTELDIFFLIDGNPNSVKLPNEKQEKPGAKR